jgi:hypothetical protein
VPVMVLVAALICYGFFPQLFVRNLAPTYGSFFYANAHLQSGGDGAVRRSNAMRGNDENAPPSFTKATAGRQGRGYSIR